MDPVYYFCNISGLIYKIRAAKRFISYKARIASVLNDL